MGGAVLSPEETTASEGSVKYSFTWHTTGIPPTGSSKRNSLLIILRFEGCELLHTLQSKFYKLGATGHLGWGSLLHAVELTCPLEGDTSGVKKVIDSRIR